MSLEINKLNADTKVSSKGFCNLKQNSSINTL